MDIVNLQCPQIGRSGGIRTPDILLPKQARYQAALHSDYDTAYGRISRGVIIPMPWMVVNANLFFFSKRLINAFLNLVLSII